MRRLTGFVITAALAAALAAGTGSLSAAGLSGPDKKEAKKMLEGVLYTRIDVPCETGRHAYGTFKKPLVEMAPEGMVSDVRAGAGFQVNVFSARSAYWALAPNDSVEVDEVDFDDGSVEIELEGVGDSDGRDSVLKFVKIATLEDFKSAFDRTFSRVPLQDEFPDWPAEIREAIAARRLVPGMSKRQAFYVTGTPVSVNAFREQDKDVEVWNLRQDSGMKMGYWSMKAGGGTGLPSTLRFEDGTLVDVRGGLSEAGLHLDE